MTWRVVFVCVCVFNFFFNNHLALFCSGSICLCVAAFIAALGNVSPLTAEQD